jgi:integrase
MPRRKANEQGSVYQCSNGCYIDEY